MKRTITSKQIAMAVAIARHEREMEPREFKDWLAESGFVLEEITMGDFDDFLVELRKAPLGSRMSAEAVARRRHKQDLKRWVRNRKSHYGEFDFRDHGGR